MEPHEFWQEILPEKYSNSPPYNTHYPSKLKDGSVLMLPIRSLGATNNGLASLILNQASFAVENILAKFLVELIKADKPDVVVGIPTLGLSLAREVSLLLGHKRYIPLGTSRKFWYDERLSVSMSSITSPETKKRLYLDPRMEPLIKGRRVCLIDDVISSGASIKSGMDLLEIVQISPISIGAAMLQSDKWRKMFNSINPNMIPLIKGAIKSPLLKKRKDGWWPESSDY